jgi:hypothetical protein
MTTFRTLDFRTGTVQFNRTEIAEAFAFEGEGLAPDQVESITKILLDVWFPFAVEDGETIDDAFVRAYVAEFLPLLQGLSRLAAEANARGAA